MAELKRWQELRSELQISLNMIAVSPDSPKDMSKSKGQHGLQARMLSDQSLAATTALGLKNVGTNMPPRALPVPTSILVSGEGIVLWIDQAEHYTDRSDIGVVRAALATHLGSA